MPVLEDGKQFEKLTCQYAIKPMSAVNCLVKEATLTDGKVVRWRSVRSAPPHERSHYYLGSAR